ncbi:Wzz/FepE/Etk N-terminal domain-containing protein [Pseudoalteromonas luteoviolacea]|uniref:Polysaccharide chain length determinant N-terminal domain-containing protein n=1 Tax=Pseudoalteromonas luteoviolacea S4060-1 TaxID=1365257 RepID=A0A162B8Y4_9GAMM|nr:Wzz/FepE/Etk N-terminal domain-containing protein [Pseudoalteromonas luteoviolacea]KZN68463.1 hypothetical protein N478_14970 [Pseudoalteromonas luteoviolacea S4060-1]
MLYKNDNVNVEREPSFEEIDLSALARSIWQNKLIWITTTVIAGILGVFYALSLPNIYKSEAILAPANESQGNVGGIGGQFGGLASLAGINLDGNSIDKKTIALEVLKSRAFLMEFIERNDLKIQLMAVNGWDRATDTFSYDPEVFDTAESKWVREVEAPFQPEPSLLEAQQHFLENNLYISESEEAGFILIGVKHYSPILAKEIVDKLISSINMKMRENDIYESEASIKYLNNVLEDTNVFDLKSMFYKLIEEQYQTKMIANVRVDYVLRVIDPAVVEEEKASPRRGGIVVMFMTVGLLLGLALSLVVRNGNRNV